MVRRYVCWLGPLVLSALLICSTGLTARRSGFSPAVLRVGELAPEVAPPGLPALLRDACDLETQLCNTLENKVPPVRRGQLHQEPASVEQSLSPQAKEDFEHALGEGLAASAPVEAATREFALRLYALIVNGSRALSNQSEADSLLEAFAGKCDAHNTGYVGAFPAKMRRVLTVEGNIREVWGLVYCLTKNKHKLGTLLRGLPADFHRAHLGAGAGARAGAAIADRRALIQKTQRLEVDTHTWGVPDFIFPPMDSWARFNFDARAANGSGLMWRGARHFTGSCGESGRLSDDPSISPPLSAAELEVQCPGESRCKLRWFPGKRCFDLVDTPLDGEQGYVRLARSLGYRMAAGPSATTANVLQLALLLGFSPNDLVLFRAAMAAWMLPVDDHSLFEIMLGADALMPPAFRMPVGSGDLAQLWPRNLSLQSSWGRSFAASELWTPVRGALSAPRGGLRGPALEGMRAALP